MKSLPTIFSWIFALLAVAELIACFYAPLRLYMFDWVGAVVIFAGGAYIMQRKAKNTDVEHVEHCGVSVIGKASKCTMFGIIGIIIVGTVLGNFGFVILTEIGFVRLCAALFCCLLLFELEKAKQRP